MKRHLAGVSTSSEGTQAQGALDEDLAQMCAKLQELRAHAESLGIFTNDRELLVCTNCGLQEDVTMEGKLLTHDCDSLDVSDSGLRFTELQDGHFSCPRCGANIVAGDDESLVELLRHGEEQVAEGKVTPVSEVVERMRQRK